MRRPWRPVLRATAATGMLHPVARPFTYHPGETIILGYQTRVLAFLNGVRASAQAAPHSQTPAMTICVIAGVGSLRDAA